MKTQSMFAEQLEPTHTATTTTRSFLKPERDTNVIRRAFLSRDNVLLPSNSQWLKMLERDTIFNKAVFDLLEQWRLTSMCPEQKVAAAIFGIANGTVDLLSIGVNGSPIDYTHPPLYVHKGSCVHAEDRTLRQLPSVSRYYLLVCYTSLAPCLLCAEKLYRAGVKAVTYIYEYSERAGKDFLLNKGTPVSRLQATGKSVPLDLSLSWQPFRSWREINHMEVCIQNA